MPLTFGDVLIAAFWAFVLVIVLRIVSRMFLRLVTRTTIFTLRPDQLDPEQLDAVLKNCYRLFPIDSLNWDGAVFKRGTILRIVTSNSTAIEGQFVGINSDEMVCLMTSNSVVAQEIQTISEISEV